MSTYRIHTLTWANNGSVIAVGTDDNLVWIWDIVSSNLKYKLKIPVSTSKLNHVGTLAFSLDNTLLGTINDDGFGAIWHLDKGQIQQKFNIGSYGLVMGISFSFDNESIHIITETACIIYHLVSQKIHTVNFDLEEPISGIHVEPDKYLIGSHNGIIGILDVSQDKFETLPILSDPIGNIFPMSNKEHVLLWDSFGIYLFDLDVRKIVRTIYEGDTITMTGCLSPSQELIATSGMEQLVGIIDISTGRIIGNLLKHSDDICTLDFSPDSLYLATGSYDGTILIWDIRAQKHFKKFETS